MVSASLLRIAQLCFLFLLLACPKDQLSAQISVNSPPSFEVTPEMLGGSVGSFVALGEICKFRYLDSLKQSWNRYIEMISNKDQHDSINHAYDSRYIEIYRELNDEDRKKQKCLLREDQYASVVDSLEIAMSIGSNLGR